MRITYDPEADALYIALVERVSGGARVTTREVAPAIYLDEARGNVVGIEILDASVRYPGEHLEKLASPDMWLTIAEAVRESGLQAPTLRAQIAHGRLEAVKRGRDWLISLSALTNYLESRDARGRPARLKRARRAKGAAA